MNPFQLFILVLFFNNACAAQESNENVECNLEMNEKKDYVKYIHTYKPFPSMAEMKNYGILCEAAMNCTSSIEPFIENSNKTLFETTCNDTFGYREYKIDEQCIGPVVKAVFGRSYNCTDEYLEPLGHPSRIREAYTDGKSCILSIADRVCTGSKEIFKKRYDEIFEIYTAPVFRFEKCINPSDKFQNYRCIGIEEQLEASMNRISVGESRVTDFLGFSSICSDAQKCREQSCLPENKEFIKTCQKLGTLMSPLINAVSVRKDFYETPCAREVRFITMFKDYVVGCVGDKSQCITNAFDEACKQPSTK